MLAILFKRFQTLVTIAVALLTLIAPAFYLIGVGYYRGQLETYSLSSNLFPLSVRETYVQAYIAVLSIATQPLTLVSNLLTQISNWLSNYWVYLSIVLLLVMVGAGIAIAWENSRQKAISHDEIESKEKIKKEKKRRPIKTFFNFVFYIFLAAYLLMVGTLVTLALFLFYASVFLIPYNEGKEHASLFLEGFQKDGCS